MSDKKPSLEDLGLDAPGLPKVKSWEDVANEEAKPNNEKHCRFCGKLVHVDSIQCAYCKKVIKEEHPLRASKSVREPWNGVAAVLSFIIPGLGQLFKGHVISGLIVFVITILSYCILIPLGIVPHIITIIDAGTREK